MATLSHHLHRIRQKPDHVKRHIAFWTSFSITAIIVLFWIASSSFTSAPAVTAAATAASPWKAMGASVSDAWSSFKSSVGISPASTTEPSLQVTPGNQ
jgi:hypothetical protein